MMPYPPRVLKDPLYDNLALIGKALSSPKRLEILDLLAQSPRTVEALAGLASLSVANASQHLQVLKTARLVESQKHGLYVEYRLSEGVGPLLLGLRQLGEEKLVEIQHTRDVFLESRGVAEAEQAEQLLSRALSGTATVLDVRPIEEFQAGHLPGARSAPVGKLADQISSLPSDREVIAYCRGPYCVFAIEAVELLRSWGFEAHVLPLGPLDWQAAGVVMERG